MRGCARGIPARWRALTRESSTQGGQSAAGGGLSGGRWSALTRATVARGGPDEVVARAQTREEDSENGGRSAAVDVGARGGCYMSRLK